MNFIKYKIQILFISEVQIYYKLKEVSHSVHLQIVQFDFLFLFLTPFNLLLMHATK